MCDWDWRRYDNSHQVDFRVVWIHSGKRPEGMRVPHLKLGIRRGSGILYAGRYNYYLKAKCFFTGKVVWFVCPK